MPGGFSGKRDEAGTVVIAGWQARELPCTEAPEAGRSWDELRGGG
ncbi:MAG: hypothetical protein QF903_04055 [Planctomycetota bacterium]|jgi:hypothetical protein|nr:hypothetical protein [Planctomycetota bacterium]MDP6762907.1 hypothetical protein [Planctomycetota bacterium]MDP6988631.1 hypothetical protein [Planctomycetota bacterium]